MPLDPIKSIAIASDSKFIFVASKGRYVSGYNVDAEGFFHMTTHGDTVMKIVLTPDNRFFVSCSSDKSIRVIDRRNMSVYYIFDHIHEGRVVGRQEEFIF